VRQVAEEVQVPLSPSGFTPAARNRFSM